MGRRPLPKRITPSVTRPLTLVTTWGISNSFKLLSPSSGQVTNALLTRSPLGHLRTNTKSLVRLACIRHAASVHPEPGSNSPQKNFTSEMCLGLTMSYILKLDMTGGAFYHSSVVKVLQTSGLDFTSITIACQAALETQHRCLFGSRHRPSDQYSAALVSDAVASN